MNIMLTKPNLIHARAAIQVEIEEGCDFDYAIETAQIVYELTDEEMKQVLDDLKKSVWYNDWLNTLSMYERRLYENEK